MKKLKICLLLLACTFAMISSCSDNSGSNKDQASSGKDSASNRKDSTNKNYNPAEPAAQNGEY